VVSGVIRMTRCACGGQPLTADTNDRISIELAVQRHQRTARHVRWALVAYPTPRPDQTTPPHDMSERSSADRTEGPEGLLFRGYRGAMPVT
jgi:hypothetical protein